MLYINLFAYRGTVKGFGQIATPLEMILWQNKWASFSCLSFLRVCFGFGEPRNHFNCHRK